MTADGLLFLVADLQLDVGGQLHVLLALSVQLAQRLKLLQSKRTRVVGHAGGTSGAIFINRFNFISTS